MEYLEEEETVFPLSLPFEEEGFGLEGGEMGVATGEDGWADDFTVVAIEGEPTGLTREPKGDFGNGELGTLGKVSVRDKSDASLVGLIALAFIFDPLGIGGKGCSMDSVATEEATG